MVRILRDGKIVDAEELDPEKVAALTEETRRDIIEILAEKPSYSAEIASKLGIGKQQAHYHFQKLKDAELVEKDHEEKKSGGTATYYRPSADAYVLDLEIGGEEFFTPARTLEVEEFLSPLVEGGSINGKIVVGSPEQHGEDQVRARDGHLAGEIGLKLGGYGRSNDISTWLDTDVVREEAFDDNLLILGGVLTNTIAKRFNDAFPVSFSLDSFPYHEIQTGNGGYSDGSIGVVAKAENPENNGKAIYLVAGIRNRGTEAAVRAFKNLEDIVEDYRGGEFYRIVRGLDMDGDGEIDDYEVVE